MRFVSDCVLSLDGWLCRSTIAALLCAFALGAQAQNKCSATGSMGTEKFALSNCAVAVTGGTVVIWFNEDPILAPEAERFQMAAYIDSKKDGKPRTQLQLTFCPGGGSAAASATAIKEISLDTNHAKAPLAGLLIRAASPKDFKVEKMVGVVKPGGAVAGKIIGSKGITTWNLDFDIKLPEQESAMGLVCG